MEKYGFTRNYVGDAKLGAILSQVFGDVDSSASCFIINGSNTVLVAWDKDTQKCNIFSLDTNGRRTNDDGWAKVSDFEDVDDFIDYIIDIITEFIE